MQKLKPPIRGLNQLQIADLIFTVSQPSGLEGKFRHYLETRYFSRHFGSADPSWKYFNTVRFFWGYALTDAKPMCLEWVRVPWGINKWQVNTCFIPEQYVDIKNSWILRHTAFIQRGIENKVEAENCVGRWFIQKQYDRPAHDIFKLYQKIGCPLPGAIPSYPHVSNLLMSPKFVLINATAKTSL